MDRMMEHSPLVPLVTLDNYIVVLEISPFFQFRSQLFSLDSERYLRLNMVILTKDYFYYHIK